MDKRKAWEKVLLMGKAVTKFMKVCAKSKHFKTTDYIAKDQFIFMDDNARPHHTRAVQQALENGNIARLEWPAMSPDMNPIEHVWDYVSRAIFNQNDPPRSTQELIVAAIEEWPQEVIND
nr:unnamed protein product [Callosobruchus chinensis]